MKKSSLIFFFIFFLYSFTEAKTIVVCKGCEVSEIGAAIAKSEANDTILIKKGAYTSVKTIINKPLTIIGEDYPVLNGLEKDEVLEVKSDNVVVSGLRIINSKRGSMEDFSGIRISSSNNVSIINCKLENVFFGIYLSKSNNCLISGNRSIGLSIGDSIQTGNGVQLWKCDSITIRNNYVSGHRDGIYFEFAKHCLIENNICEKNFRYGLHFMFSDFDLYRNNTFRSNATGVAVMYTKNVEMYGNSFEDNWGESSYGLLLKDISNSIISGNHFSNNTIGITMEGSNKMNINKNQFTGNGYALKVMADCVGDTFMYNNFSGNTFDAATNGELRQDLFKNNYWDKYEGYDLNRDNLGDVPFHPVTLYSMIIEQMPYAVMLLHSFIVEILNSAEKSIPGFVPETFVDVSPLMKRVN